MSNEHIYPVDTQLVGDPRATCRNQARLNPLRGISDPILASPAGDFFGPYSALASRACSASSKASMRRAVVCGDFVNLASML